MWISNWYVNRGLLNASTFSILGWFPAAQGIGIFNALMWQWSVVKMKWYCTQLYYVSLCDVRLVSSRFYICLNKHKILLNKRQIQNCRGNLGIGSGKYQTLLQAALPTLASGEHMPLKIQGLITCSHSNWLHVNETDLSHELCHANAQTKTTPIGPCIGMFIEEVLLGQRLVSIQMHRKYNCWQLTTQLPLCSPPPVPLQGPRKRSSARVVCPWSTQANRKLRWDLP